MHRKTDRIIGYGSGVRNNPFSKRYKRYTIIAILLLLASIVFLIGEVLYYAGLNTGWYIDSKSLRPVFAFISDLGFETAYIIIGCALYFAIDRMLAKKIFFLFILSAGVNVILKLYFEDLRPPTNIVGGIPVENSFGWPSGHSQISATFWLFIFFEVETYASLHLIKRNTKLFIQAASVLMPSAISYSRLALGVHDLADVVGGICVGLIVLGVFYLLNLDTLIEIWFSKPPSFHTSFDKKLAITDSALQTGSEQGGILRILDIIYFLVIAVSFLVPFFLTPALNDTDYNLCKLGGLLAGMCISFKLETRFHSYQPEKLKVSVRVVLGLLGLLLTLVADKILSSVFGMLLSDTPGSPSGYGGDNIVIYLVQYLFLGTIIGFGIVILLGLALRIFTHAGKTSGYQ
ncbi:MAG: phosphatase PAP2 family protein [Thermoplasmata archaeon]